MIIQATIRKFGDDIDTDVIIPARHLTSRDPAVLGRTCMQALDPNFAERINKGDVMVAGRNFGCGSSREHAVLALRGAGISCVIARGFARIFFRNAINQGMPLLTCPEAVDAAQDGAPITVDVANGVIETAGARFTAQKLPDFLRGVVATGGLLPYVRQRLGAAGGRRP
ncbi:3-isopropylmalate dehydratase small subunit [Limobrevibacterium gyesilva]|uniref:3-isopropylmalate dehydratase small subunit n=1 Tax=Limobrevibacterium gyesilva TaxID=2991712 RepID=A0AA42CI99_9PROT|nr:3-isopropylmalate dehydratase small subunit [Limobrevibacterium gyesilva]MCW3475670.1 3-isopropylmalate dehydratase small subunit [Limobrevibacterium gyesilva]